MKKSSLIILLFLGVIILLSITQGIISNKLSTKGVVLRKIEEEIHYYKTRNNKLLEKLLSYSALTNLATRAARLGFERVGEQFVLNSGSSLAVKP